MNSKNDHIRKYLGVTAWHKAGYTGKRCTVLTGEVFDGADATDHGKETRLAFLEIAPDATVEHAKFPYYYEAISAFPRAVEKTGATSMFYSCSLASFPLASRVDAIMPVGIFVAVSAGNKAEEGYNSFMKPQSVFGVGAVKLEWSYYIGDEPGPGAYLKPRPASYTSRSDLVDFAAPTELRIGEDGALGGTSCACPVLVGLATIVNDFFIDKTGKSLTYEAMYQFLKDCSKDVYPSGMDVKSGWGVPVLPEPDEIDIKKYQPDYIEPEEEEEMSYNDFLKYMQQYEAQRSAQAEPAWSKKEGHFATAKKEGIMDGTRPEDPVKRDELAAILGRMGLIGGDAK